MASIYAHNFIFLNLFQKITVDVMLTTANYSAGPSFRLAYSFLSFQ